ncbi:phage holin family protein [Galbitalea sp. SE-J8]|uniref:phage holin family protein n=1 Tax=Galbitalea sp. SE-J8 TaxID=3054952 RepID=UPI00259CAF67|nr:phage holin family protein [Galbitalea sp. SE-J8]MDM4763324.1 phage holin family protein [Galbitalea sp. SE-J8]
MSDADPRDRRGLFRLIADLPKLVVDLFRAELDSLKRELIAKLTAIGIGAGLFAAAALVAFFALAVLIAAAILGIAVALPAWLSALIVGVALLLIAGVLVLVGVSNLKRGLPPAPTDTIASVKRDVDAIKGIGRRS